jgi:cysteinyl-tRNA synthetase
VSVRLHNTMSGQVDELRPLNDDKVKLYTCGLTVYSQPHIGNWLGYIYWDVLVRVLEANGYEVERTQNITDVGHLTSDDDNGEDKMEKGARTEGVTAWDVADKYIQIADHEGYEQLKLKRPTHLARATDYIGQQIAFAKVLEDKGYLYKIDGDGMYFDTSKLDDYGKLARLDVAGLEAGKRVSVSGKKSITDFAVWKFSPQNVTRDMEWDSPWGKGFPGWHLECSVIALETLGDQLDIHTGGIDHIPVHHTNEIAQSETVTGKPFSSFWLHNNHIKVDGTKIAKSIGNIITLGDITKKGYDIEAYKLLALSKHYRTEGNFSWDILDSAQNRLNNWKNIAALRHQTHDTLNNDDDKDESGVTLLAAPQALVEALSNDLDTPRALALIDEAFDRIDTISPDKIHRHSLVQLLEAINDLLGIDLQSITPDISDALKQKIIERERARDEKDWRRSDELRAELRSAGIVINDLPSGSVWMYA